MAITLTLDLLDITNGSKTKVGIDHVYSREPQSNNYVGQGELNNLLLYDTQNITRVLISVTIPSF